MKNISIKLLYVSLLLGFCSATASAEVCHECKKTNAQIVSARTKAAVCKRAQSTAELNINNVRALINGYGNMWYDGSVARYHIPKNGNTSPLYCAALWIGGTDVNDQLRIAALRFGQAGDDYWPGPLKINGTASIDLPVCNYYDQHWIITKTEVLALKSHFEYDSSGVTQLSDPSGDITDVIKNWPGNGGEGVSQFLAPFYDANGNGEYEPMEGDYPYYDFDNALCPRTLKANNPGNNYPVIPTAETDAGIVTGGILSDQVLKGDQTIWWVFNDMGNTHTETGGQPIGIEIRAQAFAFSTNDEINNMTFYSYEIINRSTYELRETYFSQWVDPDLGYAYDDFVGCDVRRGLGYCYNGDEQDGPGSGSYSGIPPAVGIDFFQGPYMDPDGKDNPKINIPYILSPENSNELLKQQLEKYKRADGSYDTIAITDDADIFYNIDYKSWYFVPGDAVGNCAINGVNFGNNIIDDERFGMRRFVYYQNSSNSIYGEPSKASDYYNYLRGYWMNGQRMKFGGNGCNSGNTALDCDFMFPGDSDPWHWGTDGQVPEITPDSWTEITSGSDVTPGDRRFMQSAGPFTLKPGALNYITVGIPFAQASNGSAWSSVVLLRQIDDVCQALFENCFKVLDGPDAPTLTCQELNNEIILYLHYDNPESNNYNEKYSEIDPSIVKSYVVDNTTYEYSEAQRSYKFEGYQIYQLVDANASVADIGNVNKARLVAQCDVENYYDEISGYDTVVLADGTLKVDTIFNPNPSLPIGTLINFETNTETGLLTGSVMVNGSNQGIQHVFRITTDQFAKGVNTNLVNNREYYFVAVAYAQNRYKEYSQTDPEYLDGQKEPYLAGRKNERGGTITPIVCIPHNPVVEDGGKVAQSEFGMCPNIVRLAGSGNGGSMLRLTESSINQLMGMPGQAGQKPGELVENIRNANDRSSMKVPCIIAEPEYEENFGPINVRVIDPLKVKEGAFNIIFWNRTSDGHNDTVAGVNANTRWRIVKADGGHIDSVVTVSMSGDTTIEYKDYIESDFSISRYNEQLFLDLGIAVTLVNPVAAATDLTDEAYAGNVYKYYQGFVNPGALLSSQMEFANENTPWLSGVPDDDSYMVQNWIRAGSQFALTTYRTFAGNTTPYSLSEAYLDEDYFKAFYGRTQINSSEATEGIDKNQVFESVVGGLWSPYALVSTLPYHPGFNYSYYIPEDRVFDSLNINKYKVQRNLMVNFYNKAINYNDLSQLPSVRIVFTADTSKWTRCPVIEMCDDFTQSEGNARKFSPRKHASVNKEGKTLADLEAEHAAIPSEDDYNHPNYIGAEGMGWFPGYAINVTTGERLNIMFGEDSRYVQYNGRDMLWNPVGTMLDGTQNYVLGGRHYIYVMNAGAQPFLDITTKSGSSFGTTHYVTPSYDAGRWAMKMLGSIERMMQVDTAIGGVRILCKGVLADENSFDRWPVRDSLALLYSSVAWVNMPIVSQRYAFNYPGHNETLNEGVQNGIPCDVTIDIDIRTQYTRYMSKNGTTAASCGVDGANNGNMPVYQFRLSSSDAVLENLATAKNARQEYVDSILGMINVVPNPYYSYSEYETSSQLETKVRIINLPTGVTKNAKGETVQEGCYIRIYTVDGTLVRTLGPTPVNTTTYDWDLHNQTGIPIAGGVYLIHVTVPGIGERVVKWFGTMRPVDLNSFQF